MSVPAARAIPSSTGLIASRWLGFGGIDTTTSLAGAALLHLSEHPDDRRRLIDEPELLPMATEEFLRFYPPARAHKRIVAVDTQFGGVEMKHGDRRLFGHVERCLAQGGAIALFPEGDFGPREGQLLPFKKGFAHFAVDANVQVVPVGVSGMRDLWLGKRLVVRIGEPSAGGSLLLQTRTLSESPPVSRYRNRTSLS